MFTINQYQIDGGYNVKVNPGKLEGGGLIVAHDSIDITQETKGAVITALSNITAPAISSAVDCTGYSGLLVDINVQSYTSGTIQFKLQGAIDSVGSYGDICMYLQSPLISVTSLSAAARVIIPYYEGIPDSIKCNIYGIFVATVTVKVQPYNP